MRRGLQQQRKHQQPLRIHSTWHAAQKHVSACPCLLTHAGRLLLHSAALLQLRLAYPSAENSHTQSLRTRCWCQPWDCRTPQSPCTCTPPPCLCNTLQSCTPSVVINSIACLTSIYVGCWPCHRALHAQSTPTLQAHDLGGLQQQHSKAGIGHALLGLCCRSDAIRVCAK